MNNQNKKLYKSEENRIFFGVIGGIGEYFNTDPVILRVIYIIITAFAWFVPGIVAYLLMGLVIPKKVETIHETARENASNAENK